MKYIEIVKHEKPLDALVSFQGEFLNDRLDELKLMNNSLENSNFQDIRDLAHKWKGFCEPYGFNALANLSKDLEVSVDTKNVQEVTQIIGEINKYLEAKKEYIG